MTLENFRQFKPAGPVAAAFMTDRVNQVRALLGPVGGGKSVSCVFDCLSNASAMPVCKDGIIRYRVAIIGMTYGQIERNLLPTWFSWIPKKGWTEQDADFKGGGGRFGIHKIEFDVIRDGKRVPVQFEAIFAAIGEHSVEEFMRGFEPTAFWLYEMDLLPEAVLDLALTRVGRWPRQIDLIPGVEFRSYIIGDLNAPDIDSWFYDRFEENRPEGYALYKQPSGRSANAENIPNLPKGYYDRQVISLAKKPKLIKRMVDAQYGPFDDGEPVYPEYSDDIHLASEPIKPVKGLTIRLGLDAGLQRPAGVFTQWLPNGQWLVLDEIVPGRMGPRGFAALLLQWMQINALDAPVEMGFSDPAGFTGADKENDLYSWAETISSETHIPIIPAPSNEISLRLEAVRDQLSYHIDGTTPAIRISPTCKVLRKGFASHYRYAVQLVNGQRKAAPKPDKTNGFSDVQDALQYVILGSVGRYGAIQGDRHAKPGGNFGSANTTIRNTTRFF